MAYLSSENIIVFPSSKRGVKYTESRLTTESSFVNIVNKLIDTDGFLITDIFSPSLPFEFNIYGYYFRVKEGNNITAMFTPNEGDIVYGVIELQKIGENYELYGQDLDTQYRGLEFSLTVPTGSQYKYLPLLIYSNGNWNICEESLIKYTQKSLRYIVDGGEI